MPAEAYVYIYLLLCTVMLMKNLRYAKMPDGRMIAAGKLAQPKHVGFMIFLIVWLGFRPISRVFADTASYAEVYEAIFGIPFEFTILTENIIFDNIFNFFAGNSIPISFFFTVMAAVYFSCVHLASRKLFPENSSIAFFSYLVGFSTFSYGTNGVKAGAAAAILLVALAYKDRKFLFILLVITAIGIHHSMLVVAVAYLMSYFIKNTKLFFLGWLFTLIISALHIGFFQELFAGLASDKAAEYLSGEGNVAYMTGFRLDFILYSAGPVLVGYIILIRQRIHNEIYEFWVRMYLTTNGVWMLCMYASFTNRIAYLSWFMYPFVLIYPYYAMKSSKRQLVIGEKVVRYHLYFTLFMEVIFYNFIKML